MGETFHFVTLYTLTSVDQKDIYRVTGRFNTTRFDKS